MQEIYDYIKAHRDELLAARDADDYKARNIINLYNMMVRHPDRIAETLLEMSVKDWQAQHPD